LSHLFSWRALSRAEAIQARIEYSSVGTYVTPYELIQACDTLILKGQSSIYGMNVERMEITNQF
jgi:hypothetical protein